MVNSFLKTVKVVCAPVSLAVIMFGCNPSINVTNNNNGTSPTPAQTVEPYPGQTSTPLPSPTASTGVTPGPSATPGTKTGIFEIMTKVTIKTGVISAGNNSVFKYYQAVDPIPMAVDDEYANTVIFEITPSEKDNFTYENADLAKINAYTMHSCFCPPDITAPKALLKGKITGTKINSETWKIDGTNDVANFSGEFKVKK